METRRIHTLHIENIKGIKVVDLKFSKKDKIIEIRGANGQGKSSLLDAIFIALSPVTKQTKLAQRLGSDEGKIEIDFGDVVVTRVLKDGKSTLTIQDSSGTIKSAQAWLNQRMGKQNFDPMKFVNMSEDDRFKLLSKVLDIEEPLKEINLEQKELNGKRLQIVRDSKYLESDLIEPNSKNMSLGVHKIDTEEVSETYQQLQKLDISIDKDKHTLNTIISANEFMLKELKVNEGKIKALKKDRKAHKVKAEKLLKQMKMKREDFGDFFNNVADKNALILKNVEFLGKTESIKKNASKVEKFEKKLSKLKLDIIELIENSKVKGLEKLELTENKEVLWDDVPIQSLNTSEQILIGTTIAFNTNSEINVVTISDGSLLGKKVLAKIDKLAHKFNGQVIIEFMDESGKGDIVLVEGKLKK